MNATQKFFIFEVLAIYNLSGYLANDCNIIGVHEADVEQWDRESRGHFAFHRLVSLLPQVLNLSYIFILEYECLCNGLTGIVLVGLVLTVAKNAIVHPAEARYLVLIVEKLKLERVRERASSNCRLWWGRRSLCCAAIITEIWFLFDWLLSGLCQNWDRLGLYFVCIRSISFQCFS